MCSSRRVAQLGLSAACLILVSSVAVLVGGATSAASPSSTAGTPSVTTGYSAMAVDYTKPADALHEALNALLWSPRPVPRERVRVRVIFDRRTTRDSTDNSFNAESLNTLCSGPLARYPGRG